MFLDTLRLALRALMRNRTRTFLTMLGIIIGISSVIIMMSLGSSLTAHMEGVFSTIGNNTIYIRGEWDRSGGSWRLMHEMDDDDYNAIRTGCPGITYISPESSLSQPLVFGNNSHNGVINGGNENYLMFNNLKVERGTMFDAEDVRGMAKVCLIGSTVVGKLFTGGEEPIGQTIRCGTIPVTVIGILADRDEMFGNDMNDVVIMPYTTVQKRLTGTNTFDGISVATASVDDNDRVVNEIRQVLRITHGLAPDAPDDCQIQVASEEMEQLSGVLGVVILVLSLIAGISLIVGGVGIMNIMYVTVTERTREIGLRKAIGARRRNIMTQFLVESVVLSLAGGILGILTGLGIYALASLIVDQIGFVFNLSAVLISFGVCTVVGLFFGWYPARKAANLDPIQALRYE